MGSIKMIAMARLLGGGGGGGKFTIVPFGTGTDEEIAALIDAARAGKVDLQQDAGWAIGDTRTVAIGAFTGGGSVSHAAQDSEIVISSFDEYMNCGNILQFDFKDSLLIKQRMNDTQTKTGGYAASEMKTVTLPAMVNALPEWLKSRLLTFDVPTFNADMYNKAIVNVTGNKLALRSFAEVTGTSPSIVYEGEGSIIPYYETASNRRKKIGGAGSADYWWSRSPFNGSWGYFVSVNSSGGDWAYNADTAYGLSPFGCL